MPDNDKTLAAANELVQLIFGKIAASLNDPPKLITLLKDLKIQVVKKAAEETGFSLDSPESQEFCWRLASNMPDFVLENNNERRISVISLISAVFLGWFLGGILARVLDFLQMGGEILKPLSIFCTIWLEDYLAANEVARKRLLKIFGWGALAGIAARFASGILRFGTGWKTFLTGGIRPGFFRSIWLMTGIAVIFLFLSGKRSKPAQKLVVENLALEIERRLRFLMVIFSRLREEENTIQSLRKEILSSTGEGKAREDLLDSLVQMVEFLPEAQKSFLKNKLMKAGISQKGSPEPFFIWNAEKDKELYDPLGLISDGDRCLIVRRPVEHNGSIVKGIAQRVD